MISYDIFWQTLAQRKITQYQLINKYHISAGQLSRMRKNDPISTNTLDILCGILDCNIEDIVTFIPNKNNESKKHSED